MALNLVELIRVDNKTAKHIRDKFTQSWVFQYPHPVQCLHDKGSDFNWTELPMAIRNLLHQGCMLNLQKSTI